MTPWRATPDGLLIACRLTPKGGRDGIDGVVTLSDGTAVLACRVRAAAQDGEANAALCRLLASALDVPASRVRVAAGAKSRVKQVRVDGEAAGLVGRLENMYGADA